MEVSLNISRRYYNASGVKWAGWGTYQPRPFFVAALFFPNNFIAGMFVLLAVPFFQEEAGC
jgi:hypothetical protein